MEGDEHGAVSSFGAPAVAAAADGPAPTVRPFSMVAHAFANTMVPNHASRELVITVPLPEDRGREGDACPNVHRFRSRWLELGRRLRDFHARYGLTQDKVARVVGARSVTIGLPSYRTGAATKRYGAAAAALKRPRRIYDQASIR